MAQSEPDTRTAFDSRRAEWSFYGDPCPCCGGEGDYDENYDGDGWWAHYERIDACSWAAGDMEPCSRWPHERAGAVAG